jgi:hypothetical protein
MQGKIIEHLIDVQFSLIIYIQNIILYLNLSPDTSVLFSLNPIKVHKTKRVK